MNDALDLPLTLGTAGHVDHGKTTLVQALTGRNTDRLEEERRRGLSIELGFAELSLGGGRRISVVDVPGHERFVRTMVAGATGIDLFLMVVAADDGPMPQTEEHLIVLRALGLATGIVALNKSDLVATARRREVARELASLMPDNPIVEVSARTGEGMEELRAAIGNTAAAVRSRARSTWPYDQPLLHVDRVFTLQGVGTVATGTLWAGEIARGDRLRVLPANRETRVRRVQVHDRDVSSAAAGQRVALNLAGLARRDVSRGDVVTVSDAGVEPTFRLDVRLTRAQWTGPASCARVQVHHGTREAPARAVVLDQDERIVQLRLESPLMARTGDRVVVRGIAPSGPLGGGEILDAHPRRHGARAATEPLRLIDHGEPKAVLVAALDRSVRGLPGNPDDWRCEPVLGAVLHHHSRGLWERAVSTLIADGRAKAVRGRIFARIQTRSAAPSVEQPAGTAQLSENASRVLRLLREDGIQPRGPDGLGKALRLTREVVVAGVDELRAAGLAMAVGSGVVYASESLSEAVALVASLISERGAVTLAEVRDVLGISRKYAQALLEHMDGLHLTIRHGERRRLRGTRRAGAARLAMGRQESGGSTGLQSQ